MKILDRSETSYQAYDVCHSEQVPMEPSVAWGTSFDGTGAQVSD